MAMEAIASIVIPTQYTVCYSSVSCKELRASNNVNMIGLEGLGFMVSGNAACSEAIGLDGERKKYF